MGTNISSIADVQGLYINQGALLAQTGLGGKSYFVSTLTANLGSDSNEGTDPNAPLATITKAIDLCRQRRHDYIFILDFYQTDTFPIDIDKRDIHIIGIGNWVQHTSRALVDGAGEACFTTGASGGGFELAGLRMSSTGGADPCILVGAQTWYCYIHHCAFGAVNAAQDGISCPSPYEIDYWTIENNWFGDALVRDGLRLYNPTKCDILNNVFMKYGGIGINCFSQGELGAITGNRFAADAQASGSAITLAASTSNALVTDNVSVYGMLNSGYTYNPYRDLAANTANHWGMNYRGNQVIEPVGV